MSIFEDIMRRQAKNLFPHGISDYVRQRRLRIDKKLYKQKIDASTFRQALLSLGQWSGKIVWVQSSWNDFFNVDMRPTEIMALMIELVGQHGTLVMPAFPLYDDPTRQLKIDTVPSKTGLLTELFRRTPDVRRSIHLQSSVVALGPHADYLVADHHLTEYSWGPRSPYGRIYELDGLMVGLGIMPLDLTPLHYVECVLRHEVASFSNIFPDAITYDWCRRSGEQGTHTFLNRHGRIWPGLLRRHFPNEIYREFRLSNLRMMSTPIALGLDHAMALARRNKTLYSPL